MKNNDSPALAVFDAFFARPDLIWVDMTRDVVELATAIRVQAGLKTPDALQAAACLQLGAGHLFLTGDSTFRRVDGLNASPLTKPDPPVLIKADPANARQLAGKGVKGTVE
jgi:predicted nucleic acid-binding protein